MEKKIIVANWKANKTEEEALIWLKQIENPLRFMTIDFEQNEVVICPPLQLLSRMKAYIEEKKLPLHLGTQDVSQFGRGAYTGEIPASLLHHIITFCIIGHSERRRLFHEDDTMLKNKVDLAVESDLTPIFCVENSNMFIPGRVEIVAYEPVEAIGTGNPDTPENANTTAKKIKEENKNIMYVLYGGSVTSQNVSSFTKMPHINGVLVGGASLDPLEFFNIVKNA